MTATRSAPDYFPLVQGTTLRYRHSSSRFEGLELVEIALTEVWKILGGLSALATLTREREGRSFVSTFNIRRTADEVYSEGGVLDIPRREFPIPPALGARWTEPPDTQEVASRSATIETPAGKFSDCLQILTYLAGGGLRFGPALLRPGDQLRLRGTRERGLEQPGGAYRPKRLQPRQRPKRSRPNVRKWSSQAGERHTARECRFRPSDIARPGPKTKRSRHFLARWLGQKCRLRGQLGRGRYPFGCGPPNIMNFPGAAIGALFVLAALGSFACALPEPKPAGSPRSHAQEPAPQKTGAGQIPEDRKVEVLEVAFSTAVVSMAPVGQDAAFEATVERVYFWNRLRTGRPPVRIRHTWYLEGEKVGEFTLTIRWPESRAWTHKRVRPGQWRVEVTDEAGNVILVSAFLVRPPPVQPSTRHTPGDGLPRPPGPRNP